jgi:hypothetical protein
MGELPQEETWIPAKRLRGVDDELGGRTERGEDGGFYLMLTKSSFVKITGKLDKVDSTSGSRTGIMSSNVSPQFKH